MMMIIMELFLKWFPAENEKKNGRMRYIFQRFLIMNSTPTTTRRRRRRRRRNRRSRNHPATPF